MSLQKMSYDAATGTVIYCSKMHAGLKRNFQVMPGARSGWCCFSQARSRPLRAPGALRGVVLEPGAGRARAKKACLPAGVAVLSPAEAPANELAARAKAAWARLIRKVYEADPLECPKCKAPMRVIALESRMRASSGVSSSTLHCGRRSPPSAARRSVPRVGLGMPTCH